MKKQSKKSKMDEKLAMKDGKESSKMQSYGSRRHEAIGASKMGLPVKKGTKGK